MSDNACPFLIRAGQITGNIGNCKHGNIERIAKSDKPGRLIRCVDVQCAAHEIGLIRNNANASAIESCKTDYDVFCKIFMRFKKFAIIHQRADNVFHVIRLVRAVRHHGIQSRVSAFGIVAGIDYRRVFHVVCRQIRQQFLDSVNRILFGFAGKMRHAAFFRMSHSAAQILKADFFARNRFDDLRTCDKHEAGIFDHENIIGHCRRIHGSACGSSQYGRDLRDNAGCQRIPIENLSETGKRVNAFLNACAAGIIHADKRNAGFQCQVHDFANLFCVHFAQTSGS